MAAEEEAEGPAVPEGAAAFGEEELAAPEAEGAAGSGRPGHPART